VDAAAVERGRAAAAVCVACHGPAGKGDPARGIPSLAGQAPGFLRDQIRLFKQDARNPGDAALIALKAIMKTVPDERIPDLAAYYSSLR
jgi:cytochrome c553